VAVGHCILVRVYRMLTTKRPYGELVADYVDRIKADQLTRDFLKRLERLAVQGTVPNKRASPRSRPKRQFSREIHLEYNPAAHAR
jgi:hypothetical protein